MLRFEDRPKQDALKTALDEGAQQYGDEYPALGLDVYWAYEALDRMAGHLTGWKDGLHAMRASAKAVEPGRPTPPVNSGESGR